MVVGLGYRQQFFYTKATQFTKLLPYTVSISHTFELLLIVYRQQNLNVAYCL